MRRLLLFCTLLCLAMTMRPAAAQDRFEIVPDGSYTVVVYIAGAKSAATLANALTDQPRPEAAKTELLLQSLDGATLVQILGWTDEQAAASYRHPYFPAAQAYWRRDFTLDGTFTKDGENAAITPDSFVQWSEFLMRDPSGLTELGEMVGGMVDAMTLGGPDTLLSVQVLQATNELSIGLLGRWSKRDGFYVFEQEETFGDDPYWADYADNAHWMMTVLAIR